MLSKTLPVKTAAEGMALVKRIGMESFLGGMSEQEFLDHLHKNVAARINFIRVVTEAVKPRFRQSKEYPLNFIATCDLEDENGGWRISFSTTVVPDQYSNERDKQKSASTLTYPTYQAYLDAIGYWIGTEQVNPV